MKTTNSRFLFVLVLLFATLAWTTPSHAGVVYTFQWANFHPGSGETGSQITNPDGTTSIEVSCANAGVNNIVVAGGGSIQGGGLMANSTYTIVMKYRTVTIPTFPNSFVTDFHSHDLGAGFDTRTTFLGTVNTQRTVVLSGALGNAPDWYAYMACNGPGTIIIDSFTIQTGTDYTYTPAVSGGTKSNTPLGGALPTGCTSVTINPPAPTTQIVIDPTQAPYGLTADVGTTPAPMATQQANYTAITNAIAAAKSESAASITIPEGNYRFYTTNYISLSGVSDLTINGQKSTFIFENAASSHAVDLNGCQRCVIENLNVDWDWSVAPLGSIGTVVAVSGNSVLFNFPYLNTTQTTLVTKSPWLSMNPMDPSTVELTGYTDYVPSIASFSGITAESTGTDVTVNFNTALPLVVGQSYCIKHLYYGFDAFRIYSCKDTLFKSVRIFSMPGMGWLVRDDTHDLELLNCTIAERSGSTNPFTTSADGFHVSESLGNIELSGCLFTRTGDDCANIHDRFASGGTVSGSTLTFPLNYTDQTQFNIGDTIALLNPDFSPTGFTTTVTHVGGSGSSPTVLTLTTAVPSSYSPQDIVVNERYQTQNVILTHCTFQYTQGRGALIASKNVSIIYSVMDHTLSTAIKFHADENAVPGNPLSSWFEGQGSSNVVVQYNTFNYNNMRGEYDRSAIYACPITPNGPTNTYGMFHDIWIDSNTIIDSPGPAVSLSGNTQNVTVSNNTFERSTDAPDIDSLSDTLLAQYGTNISLGGNDWPSTPIPVEPDEVVDPLSTTNILPGVNVSM